MEYILGSIRYIIFLSKMTTITLTQVYCNKQPFVYLQFYQYHIGKIVNKQRNRLFTFAPIDISFARIFSTKARKIYYHLLVVVFDIIRREMACGLNEYNNRHC